MTTAISPDDYCKNPQDYKNSPVLTPKTRAYWDQYCESKKEIAKLPMPSTESIGNKIEDSFLLFFQSLLSPQSLAMIGAFKGSAIVYKNIKDSITKSIEKGISPEEIKNAEAFVEDGGDIATANLAVSTDNMVKAVADIDVEIAEEVGYSAGKLSAESLFYLLDALGSVLEWAMISQLVLQLVGMIFDSWDPCHLNDILTATQINQFNESFNTIFREQVLISVNSVVDSYGNITLNGVYPIPYYAENTALIPFGEKKYKLIRQTLMMKYLNSLRVNSEGDPIFRKKGGKLLSENDLQGMSLQITRFFGDNNTIVENFLIKWWPILVGILIILLFILFFIKKRNV